MSVNSDENKQLLELDHRSWEGEGKRGNNGVEDEERRLVEEDESKSNGRAGDVKGRQGGAVQAQTVTQQPQGSTVCWERFLPLRSLKVLLVEYDDCTRHVVTALLRNCSYEVIPVANGVQAWKILEDLTNHVDLVLTEVVMPCVSGVGLLSKIMNHKTRKNVPVIMMSSHDSMGLVFKCLSKGAVDFLVKPIRKNELKNLWQHIWRRCHSSSGSGTGSESGTQTQRSIRSKSVEKSGNNSGSNDEEDNVSTDLNIGDGSDNGSGTQSSWTKKAVEVDSPRHAYSWPHPDSTCAQVVHSNAESLGNKLLPAAATRECQQQKEQNDNFAMGKDLEICLTGTKDLQHGQRNDFSTKLAGTRQNNLLETGSCKRDEKIDKGKLNLNHESPSSMLKYDGATVTGAVTNPTDSQMDNTQFEASNRHYNALDVNNKANSDTHELPSVELSLKRLRGVEGTETTVQDDRNVLRRSDYSAFSRYNAASNANKGPSGNVGSNSPHDNSGEVTKKEFSCDIRSHSRDNPPNQCSIGGRNINDMGSTTNNDVPKSQVANKSAAAAASTVQLLHPSSAFHPVKDLKSATEHVIVDNANDVESAIRIQSRDTQKQLQIQNLHHDYDQHRVHHHVVYKKQEQHLRDNNDLSLNKLAAAAPHCGSSNGTGPVEGNPGNYSINGSGSGSNHGSNGQNGGSGGHNVGGTNLESDYGVAGKSGSGDGSGNQNGNRVDENKKQREAALTKFRQKRTERCFRKKVRYQNRKKLADQRPRIRGQFVRHTVSENTSRTTDI